MKGDSLPGTDHIVRLCKASQLDEEGHPAATAFMRRPPSEEFASVNWLEKLGLENREEQLAKVREIISNKLPRTNPSAKLALLNVENTTSTVKAHIPDLDLPILHAPTIKEDVVLDDSHAGIYNLPFPGEEVSAAEFVARSVLDVLPAI